MELEPMDSYSGVSKSSGERQCVATGTTAQLKGEEKELSQSSTSREPERVAADDKARGESSISSSNTRKLEIVQNGSGKLEQLNDAKLFVCKRESEVELQGDGPRKGKRRSCRWRAAEEEEGKRLLALNLVQLKQKKQQVGSCDQQSMS
ncbi:hypothetical protein CDL15_Pgr016542 [Punica granatum]|uniref:Uncharacterized protein n=1 Tax=Punica granatum TaxID=22663 RepID=A0A218WKL6_PUNGR|nr:hypothetical protein CDL15_Pgr016542 [Punica granatum]